MEQDARERRAKEEEEFKNSKATANRVQQVFFSKKMRKRCGAALGIDSSKFDKIKMRTLEFLNKKSNNPRPSDSDGE